MSGLITIDGAGAIDYPEFSCGNRTGYFPNDTYEELINVYLCGILAGRYWAENYYGGTTSSIKSTSTRSIIGLTTSTATSTITSISMSVPSDIAVQDHINTSPFPIMTLAPRQIDAYGFDDGRTLFYLGLSVNNATMRGAYRSGINKGQSEILGYVPLYKTNSSSSLKMGKIGWMLLVVSIVCAILSAPM